MAGGRSLVRSPRRERTSAPTAGCGRRPGYPRDHLRGDSGNGRVPGRRSQPSRARRGASSVRRAPRPSAVPTCARPVGLRARNGR